MYFSKYAEQIKMRDGRKITLATLVLKWKVQKQPSKGRS